jgi:hypothetical protein
MQYAYRAKLYFDDATLKTAEGVFDTHQWGVEALDALVAMLRMSHERDGKIPCVNIEWMGLIG